MAIVSMFTSRARWAAAAAIFGETIAVRNATCAITGLPASLKGSGPSAAATPEAQHSQALSISFCIVHAKAEHGLAREVDPPLQRVLHN